MRPLSLASTSGMLWAGLVSWLVCSHQIVCAHEGHQAATYQVTAAAENVENGAFLNLRVLDADSGQPVAARFTLSVNGTEYVPPAVGRHGLRFVSIHQRRRQQFVATYSRGTGDVLVPLAAHARSGTVTVAKGFEYHPVTARFDLQSSIATVEIRLARWIDLQGEGWHAADEHLHYERTDPRHDGDWLTMLDADGLSHAHFLVLKGGNLPGIWAQQFAYGKRGEATDGKRLIRAGEEYRDSTQGHINLLGIGRVIPPISTGGIGEPRVPYNYPPLFDVFKRTHDLGGIGGPAHGASLARSSTAMLDTVLGQVDFFEIANTHLYKTDVWYQLLNCGFIVPPLAGTDLPNFGFRDRWQPLLGEVRTYVRTGAKHDFVTWKEAVGRGEVFVTSGPIIQLEVGGVGPGGVVRLPPLGGQIAITAELASPRPLSVLEVVRLGRPIPVEALRSRDDGLHRLTIKKELQVTASCWIAARGVGGPKKAVEQGLRIRQNEMAHTGVVQVLVGDQPIRVESAIENLKQQLVRQQEYYRTQGRYEAQTHRLRFVDLFEQAMKRLD